MMLTKPRNTKTIRWRLFTRYRIFKSSNCRCELYLLTLFVTFCQLIYSIVKTGVGFRKRIFWSSTELETGARRVTAILPSTYRKECDESCQKLSCDILSRRVLSCDEHWWRSWRNVTSSRISMTIEFIAGSVILNNFFLYMWALVDHSFWIIF